VNAATKTQAETYIRTILQKRARELAKPAPTEDKTVRLVEIVEFKLGAEHYAFASAEVREVFNLTEITPLPSLPPFVLGVTNVRGRILSVVDIRRLLEFGDAGLTNLNRAIILSSAGMEIAVLADEVVGVYASDSAKWQKTIPTLVGKREAYLGGVTVDGVVVIDAEKLLQSKDLLVGAE
jgi:purine-binding chemotaxis protein CheW